MHYSAGFGSSDLFRVLGRSILIVCRDTAASYLALFEIKDMPSIAHSLERKQSGKWACLALLLAMTSSTEESLKLLEKCGGTV